MAAPIIQDRRKHPRVVVTAPMRYRQIGAEGEVYEVREGVLVDLSRSGARFRTASANVAPSQTIEILLPTPDGGLGISGTVKRVEPVGDGVFVAMQFFALTPHVEVELAAVLEILLQSAGPGTRRHARVAYRMTVGYGDSRELRALLENISRGGLQATVADALEVDEVVQVHVPSLSGGQLLALSGRVAHQREIVEGGERRYRIGVEFSQLDDDTQARLATLLSILTTHARSTP